jgi:hypothetical protein
MQKARTKMILAFIAGSLLCWTLAAPAAAQTHVVFGNNDSGMHCIDSDFSTWAILGLGNFVNAQVVQKGTGGNLPRLLTNTEVNVTYRGVTTPKSAVNTTSIGKTNFWTFVAALYSQLSPLPVIPAPNTGFLGASMPGVANTPQPFGLFDAALNRFTAPGIPITPINNKRQKQYYPLMQVEARDAANTVLGGTPVVLPISDEMHCDRCHATHKVAAKEKGIAWSKVKNKNIQTRQNILILHDTDFGTDLMGSQPVLCASCHYSAATDTLTHGQITVNPLPNPMTDPKDLSTAMHLKHSGVITTAGLNACYNCHPGTKTKCYRDPMYKAKIVCQDCHGGLAQLAGVNLTRQPWIDLPQCQSCHTGDAVSHLGSDLILRVAYDDPNTAAPRLATNTRFAENPGTLFKNSVGHHGITCEACHGSPHAIWDTNKSNDNLAAKQIQGYAGMILECSACHGTGFSPSGLGGPHGLHVVNSQTFVNGGHEDLFESDRASCQACHGLTGQGTVLSKTPVKRSFQIEDGRRIIRADSQVHCGMCHDNPFTGGGG